MARLPLPLRPGNNGSYGFVRRSPHDGACTSYPCTHYGLDLAAPQGAAVVSPVTGFVVYSVGAIPPFAGFGPHVTVVYETGAPDNFAYHLVGHMEYATTFPLFGDNFTTSASGKHPTRIQRPITEGQLIGYVSKANHIHWQVQTAPYQISQPWAAMTQDPMFWATRRGAIYAPPVSPIVGAAAAVAALGLSTFLKGK